MAKQVICAFSSSKNSLVGFLIFLVMCHSSGGKITCVVLIYMTSTVIPTWGRNLIGLDCKNSVFNKGIIQLFQNILKCQWKHFFPFSWTYTFSVYLAVPSRSWFVIVLTALIMICQVSNLWAADLQNNIYC